MLLTVRRQSTVELDVERIAEQLILNSKLGYHIYLCEDGELRYDVPCSRDGKNTLLTFYVKNVNREWELEELDEDTRTPLLEEVEREFKRGIHSLIEEAEKVARSAIDDFKIEKWKYKYDIYLGEGLVPIGEATGVFVEIVGAYELTIGTRNKPDSVIMSDMEKIRELISRWENYMRNNVFRKIERYEPRIESYDINYDVVRVFKGRVVVGIPIASEGLLTAIGLIRETQNGRN
ncbi:MAG: hypothetical protein QXS16_00480 [Pyrobaculum sp.]